MQVARFVLTFNLLVICTNVHGQGLDVYHVIIGPGTDPQVQGRLTIAVVNHGVTIRGQITGLTPGLHGFHIHEKGVLTNACKDAGPHFNPYQKPHGHPRDEHRHVGDLGNIEADSTGVALIDILDSLASLNPLSPTFIGHRSIVVHAKPDDVGRGGDEESKKTGNAGARVGCGIIAPGIFNNNVHTHIQQPHLFQEQSFQQQTFQQQPSHQPDFQGSSFQEQGSRKSTFNQQPSHQLISQGPSFQGHGIQQPSFQQHSPQQSAFQGSSFLEQGSHQQNFQGPSFQQQSDSSGFSADFQPTISNPLLENVANVRIIPGSSPAVRGNLKINEVPGGITIKGFISGLTPGPHGFHIHERGDLGDQCKNALGHFNPFEVSHGDPKDPERHVGDLGNIIADSSGVAHINIYDPLASFYPRSQAFIGNRAIVVHAKPDDLGRGGDAESQRTGNAGARVGCGIIRINDAILFPIAERPGSNFHQQRRNRQIDFQPFSYFD